MALKAKKEILAPPKAKAKTKKAVLKSIHNHKKKKKKKIQMSPTYPPCQSLEHFISTDSADRYPWKSAPRENKPDHCAIIKFPLTTKLAMKTEDNTFVFIVDVKH